MEPTKTVKLDEKTSVPIVWVGTAIAIAVTLSLWINSSLGDLKNSVRDVARDVDGVKSSLANAGADRFTLRDAESWADVMRARNPQMTIPDPVHR